MEAKGKGNQQGKKEKKVVKQEVSDLKRLERMILELKGTAQKGGPGRKTTEIDVPIAEARRTTQKVGVKGGDLQATKYHVVDAHDFIGNVATGTVGNSAGDSLLEFELRPRAFTNTRLYYLSQMYQNFRFLSATVRYVPSCPTTTTGSIIGFINIDPDDQTFVGNEAIRWAESSDGMMAHSVYVKGTYSLPRRNNHRDYFCDPSTSDERLTTQGHIRVIAETALAANIPLGSLYIDYKVKFYVESTRFTSGGGYSMSILSGGTTNGDAWANLTTRVDDSHNAFPLYLEALNNIRLPNAALGEYYMLNVRFTAAAITNHTQSLTGFSQITTWNENATNFGTATTGVAQYLLQVTLLSPVIALSCACSAGSVSKVMFFITRLVSAVPISEIRETEESRLKSMELELLEMKALLFKKKMTESEQLTEDEREEKRKILLKKLQDLN